MSDIKSKSPRLQNYAALPTSTPIRRSLKGNCTKEKTSKLKCLSTLRCFLLYKTVLSTGKVDWIMCRNAFVCIESSDLQLNQTLAFNFHYPRMCSWPGLWDGKCLFREEVVQASQKSISVLILRKRWNNFQAELALIPLITCEEENRDSRGIILNLLELYYSYLYLPVKVPRLCAVFSLDLLETTLHCQY